MVGAVSEPKSTASTHSFSVTSPSSSVNSVAKFFDPGNSTSKVPDALGGGPRSLGWHQR